MKGKMAAAGRKILWFLKTRYFLAFFCIILEFAQIMVLFSFLYQYFYPITVAGRIFSMGVLLYLINRDETPEFKLPWVFLMLIIPLVGALAFVVLSSTESGRTLKSRHEEAKEKLAPYLRRLDAGKGIPEAADGEARLQVQYLCRASGMSCCRNAEVVYYRTGQEFHSVLLDV